MISSGRSVTFCPVHTMLALSSWVSGVDFSISLLLMCTLSPCSPLSHSYKRKKGCFISAPLMTTQTKMNNLQIKASFQSLTQKNMVRSWQKPRKTVSMLQGIRKREFQKQFWMDPKGRKTRWGDFLWLHSKRIWPITLSPWTTQDILAFENVCMSTDNERPHLNSFTKGAA